MSVAFNITEILSSIVKKAEEDKIITEDEMALIEEIRLEGKSIQEQIKNLEENNETGVVLKKVLSSASKIMLKNMISKAREDGKITDDEMEILELLFKELGYDLDNFKSRPWYVFKICLKIEEKTPIDELLDYFDKVFCLRGLNPEEVYSGLCLGTKHYVIEDVDATLLTFALTGDTTKEWVTKGAFATIQYNPNFERTLYNTAYDLLVENYFSKIQ